MSYCKIWYWSNIKCTEDTNTDTDMFHLGKKLVVCPQWPSNTLEFFLLTAEAPQNALLCFWDNAHAHFDHATTKHNGAWEEEAQSVGGWCERLKVFGQVCSGETRSTYRNWNNSISTDTNFGIGAIDIRLDLSSSTVVTESSLAQSGLFQTQVYYCVTEDSVLKFYKSDDNLQWKSWKPIAVTDFQLADTKRFKPDKGAVHFISSNGWN